MLGARDVRYRFRGHDSREDQIGGRDVRRPSQKSITGGPRVRQERPAAIDHERGRSSIDVVGHPIDSLLQFFRLCQ